MTYWWCDIPVWGGSKLLTWQTVVWKHDTLTMWSDVTTDQHENWQDNTRKCYVQLTGQCDHVIWWRGKAAHLHWRSAAPWTCWGGVSAALVQPRPGGALCSGGNDPDTTESSSDAGSIHSKTPTQTTFIQTSLHFNSWRSNGASSWAKINLHAWLIHDKPETVIYTWAHQDSPVFSASQSRSGHTKFLISASALGRDWCINTNKQAQQREK